MNFLRPISGFFNPPPSAEEREHLRKSDAHFAAARSSLQEVSGTLKNRKANLERSRHAPSSSTTSSATRRSAAVSQLSSI